MRLSFSPVVFAMAYCVGYVAVLALDAALFIYYPQLKRFAWGWDRLANMGPGMAWYGLMASAALFAGPIAVVGSAVKPSAMRNCLWCLPLFGLLGCVFLMRHFFLR